MHADDRFNLRALVALQVLFTEDVIEGFSERVPEWAQHEHDEVDLCVNRDQGQPQNSCKTVAKNQQKVGPGLQSRTIHAAARAR